MIRMMTWSGSCLGNFWSATDQASIRELHGVGISMKVLDSGLS